MTVAARAKTAIKDLHFRETVQLYNTWRGPEYQPASSQYLASGCYQNASLQMAVNTRNSTSACFGRRFKKYLRHRYAMDGKQAWQMVAAIMADKYDGSDERVLHFRQCLEQARCANGRLEDHPHLLMPLLYQFLQYFESAQGAGERSKQVRLFTLVPTKQGFECSHLKICSNGLYGLLKRAGVQGLPTEGTAWRAMAAEFWHKLFDLSSSKRATESSPGRYSRMAGLSASCCANPKQQLRPPERLT